MPHGPSEGGCANLWTNRGRACGSRASELGTGLEAELHDSVRRWVEERWPFRQVADPGRGRELPLDRYEALPDR